MKAGEEGISEHKMVGWHHQLNADEFEYTLGVGDGQGGLHAVAHGVAKSRHDLATELT